LLAMLIVLVIVVSSHSGFGVQGQPSGPSGSTPVGTSQPAQPLGPSATPNGFLQWISLGIAASVVVLALMAWLISQRRSRTPWLGRELVGREKLAAALDESLDALRSHPDPREAVIRAYSAMERALARAGRARRHFEAPLEFVNRVLVSIPGAGSDARTLTDLFELARFSQHQIDARMRDVAVNTLSNIRRQLQAES
jgi:hypothetical protein